MNAVVYFLVSLVPVAILTLVAYVIEMMRL
jgi:hypothetical protein